MASRRFPLIPVLSIGFGEGILTGFCCCGGGGFSFSEEFSLFAYQLARDAYQLATEEIPNHHARTIRAFLRSPKIHVAINATIRAGKAQGVLKISLAQPSIASHALPRYFATRLFGGVDEEVLGAEFLLSFGWFEEGVVVL